MVSEGFKQDPDTRDPPPPGLGGIDIFTFKAKEIRATSIVKFYNNFRRQGVNTEEKIVSLKII